MHKKYLVITFLFALAGCFSQKNEPAPGSQGAALSPNPEMEKPSEDKVPDESTEPESLKFEWFKGVASLPEEHPCHDNTIVVVARDSELNKLGGDNVHVWDFHTSTVGERRRSLDTSWTFFGPRTVQGVRWTDGDTQHLVVTCLMTGNGFTEVDVGELNQSGFDPGDAVFVEGMVGEPNHVERASISWMERKQGGEWRTTRDLVEWAVCDECNSQHFIARMVLLSVTDQDQDREPEFVWMQLQNRQDCPGKEGAREICFDLKLSALEGRDEETWLSLLSGPDLKLEGSTSQPITADASDGRKLLAGLAKKGHTEAISKAKSILRDAGKLHRNKPGNSCHQVRPDEAQIQEHLSGTSVD